MNAYTEKIPESKNPAAAGQVVQKEKKSEPESLFPFVDKGPEAIAQRKFQEMADNSTQVRQLQVFQLVSNSKVIQRNQNAAQNYAPPAGKAFQNIFRAQHTPNGNGFSDETAIGIHEIRGDMAVNTLIDISDASAIYDIQNELLGMSDEDSDDLVNREKIWITTSGKYDFIETSLDKEGRPYVSNRGHDCMNLRLQWSNAGYYQIYHFGQVGAW